MIIQPRSILTVGGVASPTLSISAVTLDDPNHVTIVFTDVVEAVDVGLFTGFAIEGNEAGSINIPGGSSVQLGFSGAVNVNDNWSLFAQPPWLVTPIVVPQIGSVSA